MRVGRVRRCGRSRPSRSLSPELADDGAGAVTGATTRRRLKVLLPVLGARSPCSLRWSTCGRPAWCPSGSPCRRWAIPTTGWDRAPTARGRDTATARAGSVSVNTLIADPARPADVRSRPDGRRGDVGHRRPRGPRLHAERHLARADDHRRRSATWSRCGCATSRCRRASPCTGTASTCRTRWTGWPGSPRTPSSVGGEFRYRFVVDRVGTYWYHSHQLSHEQVIGGLLGRPGRAAEAGAGSPPASTCWRWPTPTAGSRRSTASRATSGWRPSPASRCGCG